MRLTQPTAAARLDYAPQSMPNFDELVARMDTALCGFGDGPRSDPWQLGARPVGGQDGDGMAIFDVDHCRIALALHHDRERSGNLVVAVGPNGTRPADDAGPFRPRSLCQALVADICSRYSCDMIVWAEAPSPISPGTLQEILTARPPMPLPTPSATARDLYRIAWPGMALPHSCRI